MGEEYIYELDDFLDEDDEPTVRFERKWPVGRGWLLAFGASVIMWLSVALATWG